MIKERNESRTAQKNRGMVESQGMRGRHSVKVGLVIVPERKSGKK